MLVYKIKKRLLLINIIKKIGCLLNILNNVNSYLQFQKIKVYMFLSTSDMFNR